MLLYIDEYETLQHNRNLSLLEIFWNPATSKLRTENYTSRFDNMATYINQYKPQNILANFQGMVYKGRANFEVQLLPKLKTMLNNSDVKKFAFINSSDKITNLLFEPVLKSKIFEQVNFRMFENEDEAKQWLLGGRTEAN